MFNYFLIENLISCSRKRDWQYKLTQIMIYVRVFRTVLC